MSNQSRKSVFEYTDYRQYLGEYYAWAKEHTRGFSHRSFMAKTGMSGPNYFKRVMEGVHDLTEKSIPKFCTALGLAETEANYFKHLVFFNQAKTLAEKDASFQVLMDLKTPHRQVVLEKAQYDYYQDWYNVAIRETLAFFEYKDNPQELGKLLAPPVQPKRVKKAIELLKTLGLVEKTTEGALKPTSQFVLGNPEVQSLLIPKFHQTMARLAEEAITRFPKSERNFSSSTVSMSAHTYQAVTEIIQNTRKEILRKVGEDIEPDRVYHLNMQLFPLTVATSKRKRKV